MTGRVLLVEDEASVRFAVARFLRRKGFDVSESASCAEAFGMMESSRFDAAVLDFALPDGDALQILDWISKRDVELPTIVLTGHGSIDLAVRAVRKGAQQFLTKPVELPALVTILERMIGHHRNHRLVRAGRVRASGSTEDPFRGESTAIQELAKEARIVAESNRPVLIEGETGTGKGVLSRWLHEASPRVGDPFVDVNCASLTQSLLESELFGYEKGAFTGADARKVGLIEAADGGTIFLDEIGDLDLGNQPKFLKVLEEGQLRRMGSTSNRRIDVRLIAASHHDLPALCRESRFRTDLYYRISTLTLRVPALRERAEDIPVLSRYLLQRCSMELGRPGLEFTDRALDRLVRHGWPGNIRELKNVIERAALLADRSAIDNKDLRLGSRLEEPAGGADDETLSLSLAELQKLHIQRVLAAHNGNVQRTAEVLGIARSTLYQRLREFGLGDSES